MKIARKLLHRYYYLRSNNCSYLCLDIKIKVTQYQQEPEKKAEEKSDATKREEAQHRPKWMPPGHAG